MNDRTQALEILKRARDLLAERLTERVIAARESILEEAVGLSYGSEIDALYEQLGLRLCHLAAMIAALPEEKEAGDEAERTRRAPSKAGDSAPSVVTLALPAPPPVAGLIGSPLAAGFQSFVHLIRQGRAAAAGIVLARLFDLEVARGVRCAETFQLRLYANEQYLFRPIQLRQAVVVGDVNDSLTLLGECFGLSGVESIGVFETLRSRAG